MAMAAEDWVRLYVVDEETTAANHATCVLRGTDVRPVVCLGSNDRRPDCLGFCELIQGSGNIG
jgi:hypothetical protein